MMTKPHCDCDDDWRPGLSYTIFDHRDMAEVVPPCQECGLHPWYDAYDENEGRDLKEMNT